MKTFTLWTNIAALLLMLGIFLHGLVFTDLDVRMRLTELDRAGCINAEKFGQFRRGMYSSPRSPEFSHYLSEPWVNLNRTTLVVASLLAVVNLGLLRVRQQDAIKSSAPAK